MLRSLRSFMTTVFTPLARLLLALRVSPDAVERIVAAVRDRVQV